jgi:uncharacterized membrane protein YqaE (UPF0057 family)
LAVANKKKGKATNNAIRPQPPVSPVLQLDKTKTRRERDRGLCSQTFILQYLLLLLRLSRHRISVKDDHDPWKEVWSRSLSVANNKEKKQITMQVGRNIQYLPYSSRTRPRPPGRGCDRGLYGWAFILQSLLHLLLPSEISISCCSLTRKREKPVL